MSAPDGYEKKVTQKDVATVRWSDVLGDEATLRALMPREFCDNLFKVLQENSTAEARLRADNEQLRRELEEQKIQNVQRVKRQAEEADLDDEECEMEEKVPRQDLGMQSQDTQQATGSSERMQE